MDALAKASNAVFKSDRLASVTQIKVKGRTLILIKPSTYMNLSGKAVNYWMQKEGVPIENLFVISDDIAIPFGSIRIRKKGSDGGHNGLKNITETIQSDQYARLRFGVGSEFSKGNQIDYVLGEWTLEEQSVIEPLIKQCCDAITSLPFIGIDRTMNLYNKK